MPRYEKNLNPKPKFKLNGEYIDSAPYIEQYENMVKSDHIVKRYTDDMGKVYKGNNVFYFVIAALDEDNCIRIRGIKNVMKYSYAAYKIYNCMVTIFDNKQNIVDIWHPIEDGKVD